MVDLPGVIVRPVGWLESLMSIESIKGPRSGAGTDLNFKSERR